MKRRRLLASSAALLAGGTGCLGRTRSGATPDGSTDGGGGQSGSGAGVEDAKRKLEAYQNHVVATDDGYRNTETCIRGLGVSFVNDDVHQVSYDEPNVLFYDRTATDQYELMGAEWFVPTSDVDEPPALFAGDDRQRFRGPMAGQHPGQSEHFGLHVWLFSENPNGTFADANPELTCEG
ncbi:MAG: hypothetical protein R3324_04200 [Halobacteriales archaeon]|nr:hypothetical protein [Halobacteriales archaeon]